MNIKKKITVLLLVLSFSSFCFVSICFVSIGSANTENTRKTIEKNSVSQLIQKLKSDKASTRALAAKELGEKKYKEAVPYLIETLKDKELTVKSEACVALGKIKDVNSVPALVERLKDKKENWSIQTKSAEALANIGDNAAFEPLADALKNECEQQRENLNPPIQLSFGTEDEAIESKIAQSLFELVASSKDACIPLLLEKTKAEKEMSKYRYYMAITLGQLCEKEITPVLIEYLSNSENGLFREKCARILGDLGDKTAIEPLKRALKDNFICISTGDVKKVYGYTVRLAAYSSLKKMGIKVEKRGGDYQVIE